MSICHRRQKLLFEALELPINENKNNAAYYTQFDIEEWAKLNYGEGLFKFISKNASPVDVLYKLANDYSVVLLSGNGFYGPEWSIRISLANLYDEAYTKIGKAIREILNGYIVEWQKIKK